MSPPSDQASSEQAGIVAIPNGQYDLLVALRSAEGADNFVSDMVYLNILSDDCDWGKLLGMAPMGLCNLCNCFVFASQPAAASIQLSTDGELR